MGALVAVARHRQRGRQARSGASADRPQPTAIGTNKRGAFEATPSKSRSISRLDPPRIENRQRSPAKKRRIKTLAIAPTRSCSGLDVMDLRLASSAKTWMSIALKYVCLLWSLAIPGFPGSQGGSGGDDNLGNDRGSTTVALDLSDLHRPVFRGPTVARRLGARRSTSSHLEVSRPARLADTQISSRFCTTC